MKTSELTGAALDWAVAKALGWLTYPTDSIEQGQWYHTNRATAPRGYEHNRVHVSAFHPSTDWAQGGPIIERERIELTEGDGTTGWLASMGLRGKFGPTPLIASMRCYAANKLGDEVEVPVEFTEK